MAVVAFNTRTKADEDFDPKLKIALVFFAIVLIGGSIITIREEFGTMLQSLTGSSALGKLVMGGMFGFVVAHFIVDAHAWRLRDKPQRNFVMERMRFIGRPRNVIQIASADPVSAIMPADTLPVRHQ